jgi:hypothetical protein
MARRLVGAAPDAAAIPEVDAAECPENFCKEIIE